MSIITLDRDRILGVAKEGASKYPVSEHSLGGGFPGFSRQRDSLPSEAGHSMFGYVYKRGLPMLG